MRLMQIVSLLVETERDEDARMAERGIGYCPGRKISTDDGRD
jgi:hypothetical protein